jgi:pyrroline-5-carboxylate reductase
MAADSTAAPAGPTAGPAVLQVLGGGRMGEALVAGLLDAGWVHPGGLRIVEIDATRRAELSERFVGVEVTDTPGPAVGVIVAVKPADAVASCTVTAAHGVERVLSIAAGISTAQLEAAFPGAVPVVRAMPNTPAQVGAGASAIAAGAHATAADLAWASEILGSVGLTVEVPEDLLDAVTGLSGSGPGYLFAVVEALVEAGVAEGLPADVAGRLVVQTLAGAARLLESTGADAADAAELRRNVTSPGGTTAAGLAVLDDRGVRSAIVDAVAAATRRSRELGAVDGANR